MPQLQCPPLKNLFDIDVNNTTPLQDMYLELEGRAKIETNNLRMKSSQALPGISSKMNLKIELINATLHLLRCAIYIKENISEYIGLQNNPQPEDIDLAALNAHPFNSMDDLLDYKPSFWNPRVLKYETKPSLREALNISRNAAFLYESLISLVPFYNRSRSISFFPPIWGKTTTLDDFEKKLAEEFDLAAYKQTRQPVAHNETEILLRHQEIIRRQEASESLKYANDRRGGPGGR